MSPENKILFICARQEFLNKHKQEILEICRAKEDIDWHYIYSVATSHGIAALVYYNLQSVSTKIPDDILEKLLQSYAYSVVRATESLKKTKEMLSFFNRRSIDIMLLKGTALDILGVYKKPWYTSSNDVDLIIRPIEKELSEKDKREIPEYLQNCPWCEWELNEHHDVNMNGVLPIDFGKIWTDASKIKFSKQDAFVMSSEDLLISVCINSSRKRFIKLKSLCDISEIVANQSQLNLSWDKMVKKARAYQCNDIVYAALFVAKITLDCKIPHQVFSSLEVNPVKEKIIRFLGKRMTLSSSLGAYSNRNQKRKLLGRKIDPSIFLPFITLRGDQIWQKAKVIWKTR